MFFLRVLFCLLVMSPLLGFFPVVSLFGIGGVSVS
nr:MAG TPA: hypothetical protein [Caudoviricetes sp.]